MEELDFKVLLDRFHKDGFTRGERIILANYGTNQTLLSLIFGKPANIKLIIQSERNGDIVRSVEINVDGILTCRATSYIPIDRNRQDVVTDIKAGQLGLGQIVDKYNLATRRNLMEIGRDLMGFWRTYVIEGAGCYLKIHEYFLRQAFLDAGWIEPWGDEPDGK